jgi:hypothetical protein
VAGLSILQQYWETGATAGELRSTRRRGGHLGEGIRRTHPSVSFVRLKILDSVDLLREELNRQTVEFGGGGESGGGYMQGKQAWGLITLYSTNLPSSLMPPLHSDTRQYGFANHRTAALGKRLYICWPTSLLPTPGASSSPIAHRTHLPL